MNHKAFKPIEILFVEDDPGDRELTTELLNGSKLKLHMHSVDDGEKAMQYLRKEGDYANQPKPDLILLDLNLPRKNGREILQEIKADDRLKRIPVVILTTSKADEDILNTYDLGASCYVTKPVGLAEFTRVVQAIDDFWLTVVRFPTN